jgi:hypothetical protein
MFLVKFPANLKLPIKLTKIKSISNRRNKTKHARAKLTAEIQRERAREKAACANFFAPRAFAPSYAPKLLRRFQHAL